MGIEVDTKRDLERFYTHFKNYISDCFGNFSLNHVYETLKYRMKPSSQLYSDYSSPTSKLFFLEQESDKNEEESPIMSSSKINENAQYILKKIQLMYDK